jgi:flagellar hook-length control protein FliK
MDPIAAMPTPATPVADTKNARDARNGDAPEAGGFDEALAQELAMLSPEGEKPADEAKSLVDATLVSGDATTAVDPAVAADAAIAALIGDAAQPLAVAVMQQPVATPVIDTTTQTADDTEADPAIAAAAGAGQRRGLERAATERGAADRKSIERGLAADRAAPERTVVDRATAERSTLERGTLERLAAGRAGAEREPGELREAAGVRDAQDLPGARRDKAAADTPTASFLAALGAERNAAAEAPAPVAAAVSALDSLSAASLAAKWTAPGTPGIFDPAPAPVTARVDTPLGTSGWADAFQQKIVWLVDRQLGNAELHVNPPHLGPVEVMLNLSDEGTRIAFCSPHAAVRDAIEASLPELRAALDDRGLTLGQASVSADSGAAREQFSNDARESARQTHHGRPSTGPVIAEAPMATLRVQRGIVDLFA